MSQFCLETMMEAGVRDFAIIIGGAGSNKVKEYYGGGEQFGVKITYVEQDYPRGIAHAISLCKDFVGNDRFLVFLGDNIIQKSISDFAKKFENSDASASILLCEVDNPSRFGIAEIKDGEILRIIEKPKDPPSNLAVTGIYFLTNRIFDIIQRLKPSCRNELEITDALHMFLKENYKITYYMITDYWKDTGTPEDIINANGAILENMTPYFFGKKESQVIIEGNVMVGKGTIIKSGTRIKGPVIIGNDCKIGPDVKIGPNTSIGDNSDISRCSIDNSIIMSGCKISGDFPIKNSIIAFNAEITKSSTPEKVFLLGEGTKISL